MLGLKAKVLVYQAAMWNGVLKSSTTPKPVKDIPKAKDFNGTKSAKDVENIIWCMEQYFRGMSITNDAEKVNIVVVYLTDVTLLWWRDICSESDDDDIPVGTWKDFQSKLKEHFYPKNSNEEARDKLHQLKHDGSIR